MGFFLYEFGQNHVAMNQKTFLASVGHGQIAGLFDHIPGYSFFVKNAAGEIMKANRAFSGIGSP